MSCAIIVAVAVPKREEAKEEWSGGQGGRDERRGGKRRQ